MTPKNNRKPARGRKFRGIGRLAERSLHAAIKRWYASLTDSSEVKVDGFVIDLVRGDTLIEIQTGSFAAIRRKLATLLEKHRVRLVYPIAKRKWIVRVSRAGKTLGRVKSPREGKLTDLFTELVSMPDLIAHPNLTLDVLMIEQEEVRCDDGKGSWRRHGVSIVDQRLVSVLNRIELHGKDDFLKFLPAGLAAGFTSRELGKAMGERVHVARRVTYCLRKMGAVRQAGVRERQFVYERAGDAAAAGGKNGES